MPSHLLTEEVLPPTLLDEYKCVAPAMLCELEEMLNYFSKSKFILPQGILDVVSYSWKELVEGACYNKKLWQGLTYNKVKSGIRQTAEDYAGLSSKFLHTDYKMAENVKSQCGINAIISTGVVKGNKNHETVLNSLPENKTAVSQQHASNLPVAISFSLASKLCDKRGWVFQHPDCNSRDLELKESCDCAVEKLQQDKIQITDQLPKLKESGEACEKPVILHHYGDVRKNIRGWTFSSEVLDEKLQVPVVKQAEPFFKKLLYRLADGSSFIYYPSGHCAVCQSRSDLPGGGMYTNLFNDFPDRALLGTFTPFEHGSIYFPNSNNIAVIFNQEGGMVTKKDGEMPRQWKWLGAGKLDDPIIIWVNKYITVKIEGRFAVCLVYKWQHKSVQLSLSPMQGVAVPYLENLSKSPRLTKIHGILEEELNHFKDFRATKELKILQRKIKNILENWMEYYRIALGIRLPHTGQTLAFPQRAGRLHRMQLAGASLDIRMAQGREDKKNDTKASVSEHPLQFRSATVCSLIQEFSAGAFSENSWCSSHTPCPVALRRTMLGDKRKICRCSNHQIPYVTDLEYNHIVNNQMSSPEQITVVCVTSSLRATGYGPSSDKHLDQLYERMNKNRSMPCKQGCLDSFRLLKYNINSADEFTDHCGALLVKKHNIGSGMILMYIRGKLLFANYIFNGYSRSANNLQKQIELTRSNYHRGYCLPMDYRFSSVIEDFLALEKREFIIIFKPFIHGLE